MSIVFVKRNFCYRFFSLLSTMIAQSLIGWNWIFKTAVNNSFWKWCRKSFTRASTVHTTLKGKILYRSIPYPKTYWYFHHQNQALQKWKEMAENLKTEDVIVVCFHLLRQITGGVARWRYFDLQGNKDLLWLAGEEVWYKESNVSEIPFWTMNTNKSRGEHEGSSRMWPRSATGGGAGEELQPRREDQQQREGETQHLEISSIMQLLTAQ